MLVSGELGCEGAGESVQRLYKGFSGGHTIRSEGGEQHQTWDAIHEDIWGSSNIAFPDHPPAGLSRSNRNHSEANREANLVASSRLTSKYADVAPIAAPIADLSRYRFHNEQVTRIHMRTAPLMYTHIY